MYASYSDLVMYPFRLMSKEANCAEIELSDLASSLLSSPSPLRSSALNFAAAELMDRSCEARVGWSANAATPNRSMATDRALSAFIRTSWPKRTMSGHFRINHPELALDRLFRTFLRPQPTNASVLHGFLSGARGLPQFSPRRPRS